MIYLRYILFVFTSILISEIGYAVNIDSIPPFQNKSDTISSYTESGKNLKYEYKKVKKAFYKRKLGRYIYDFIFRDIQEDLKEVVVENSEDRFVKYTGRRIRNINIRILPPYGNNVYDTINTKCELNIWENIANKIHINTNAKLIRNQITIKNGDIISSFEIVQNEILLKNIDYIYDAIFLPVEIQEDTTHIDLNLIVKDKFSWGGSVSSNFKDSFDIDIENRNLFGWGHLLRYSMDYDKGESKEWGHLLEYRFTNIFSKHTDLSLFYRDDYLEKELAFNLNRDFISNKIKIAGGIDVSRVYYANNLPDRGELKLKRLFDYAYLDIWGGYMFYEKDKYNYNRSTYITGRFFANHFMERPLIIGDENMLYRNRRNAFVSYSYLKLKYYKANLIYDFGRTEEIPNGVKISFTSGLEDNEFKYMGYIGAEANYSFYIARLKNYYSFYLGLGGYISTKGLEHGMIKFRFSHFSRMFNIGKSKARFFADINYIRGLNRYSGDYLYITGNDIRGLSLDDIMGYKKISTSLSTTIFFPFVKRGFRTSLNLITDFASIVKENEKLFKSKIYCGLGLQLNIRNENIIIRNISFRLMYYPNITGIGDIYKFRVIGSRGNHFYNYRVGKPAPIRYE